jgi:hypothetical protein
LPPEEAPVTKRVADDGHTQLACGPEDVKFRVFDTQREGGSILSAAFGWIACARQRVEAETTAKPRYLTLPTEVGEAIASTVTSMGKVRSGL